MEPVTLVVVCPLREETRELRVQPSTRVCALETTLGELFEGTGQGWGLYLNAERERWLHGTHVVAAYLPLAAGCTLEWRERSRVAELVFLNGTRTRVRVDDSQVVGDIVRSIGGKLGLAASVVDEFGIKFGGKLSAGLSDKDAITSGWLDEGRTLQQQGVTAATKLELRWLKRWFVHEHSLVTADETALLYVFLECKHAFLADALDTRKASVAALAHTAAALLAVDHGRFDKKKHTPGWFAGKRYVPDSWTDGVTFAAVTTAWRSLEDATTSPKKLFIDACHVFPGFASTHFDAHLADTKENVIVTVDSETLKMSAPWGNGTRQLADVATRRLSRAALALSPRGKTEDDKNEPEMSLTDTDDETGPRRSPRGADAAAAVPLRSGSSASLKRTFTLGRIKKSSTPNLLASGSQRFGSVRGESLLNKASASSSPPSSTSSGRFKGLALLKRNNSLRDSAAIHDAGGDGSASALLPQSGVGAESQVARDTGARASMESDVAAARSPLKTVALEELCRWTTCGASLVLDVAESAPIRLALSSTEDAADLSALLHGYCRFRMEDVTLTGPSCGQPADAMLMQHVQSIARQLVDEAFYRVATRVLNIVDSALLERLRVAAMSGALGELSEGLAAARELASAAGAPAALGALAFLEACCHCAYPDVEVDESKPIAELEPLRCDALACTLLFAAMSNTLLLDMQRDDPAFDGAIAHLVTTLEEATRRPHSIEAHQRLVRGVRACAPALARSACALDDANAVAAMARCCRNALSRLLDSATSVEALVSRVATLDDCVRDLFEAAAALHNCCLPSAAAMERVGIVARDCLKLLRRAGCEPWCTTASGVQSLASRAMSLALDSRSTPNALPALAPRLLGDALLMIVPVLSDAHCGSSLAASRAIVEAHLEAIEDLARQRDPLWDELEATVLALEFSGVQVVAPPTEHELRAWSDEWRSQMANISNLLKSLKSALRAEPPLEWLPLVCRLAAQVDALTRPFVAHELTSASTNIVRTFQLMCVQVYKCARGVGGPEGHARVVRDVDAMLTVLNYNNPTQTFGRGRGGDALIGAGGGWQRRDDMSNKGAALRMVLTQKTEKPKYMTSRRINMAAAAVNAPQANQPPQAASKSPLHGRTSRPRDRPQSGQWVEVDARDGDE